ncbi:hypothetical protein CBM2589_U10035 [Cupriavidus taiwanensis]|uniref:Uncharacterized protein n=2 Tax=Cupriavidus taiwanensis TaxID=164546 RepID=A0A375CQT0_9BURK|nr:hypothetical protein CBM2589_U10035 [Cupriavidus taiwanensis]
MVTAAIATRTPSPMLLLCAKEAESENANGDMSRPRRGITRVTATKAVTAAKGNIADKAVMRVVPGPTNS